MGSVKQIKIAFLLNSGQKEITLNYPQKRSMSKSKRQEDLNKKFCPKAELEKDKRDDRNRHT